MNRVQRSVDATDEDRFDALWRGHADQVLAYARRRTPTEADAVDIVAETFLVAWRRLDVVPANARPWLYAVAGNVLANQRRSGRRQTALTERLVATSAGGVAVADAVDDARVVAALDRLAEPDREVLRLVAWEGLSRGEAAAVVGCSASTFGVRLHRARRRLAAELRKEGAELPVFEEKTT